MNHFSNYITQKLLSKYTGLNDTVNNLWNVKYFKIFIIQIHI